jgi:hypothetical protein
MPIHGLYDFEIRTALERERLRAMPDVSALAVYDALSKHGVDIFAMLNVMRELGRDFDNEEDGTLEIETDDDDHFVVTRRWFAQPFAERLQRWLSLPRFDYRDQRVEGDVEALAGRRMKETP